MDLKIKALSAKYEADKNKAEALFSIYLENSVGIGEHPDIIKEMDSIINDWSEADGKYNSLVKMMNIIKEESE